ncbi:MAG: type II toxin-antitoxin system HicB family antitoxin [Bacteroidales bacterium]|nr:type II toxin-antitoxin system HicB family antitoxin [Bacteroidales bacterium]
MSPSPATSTLSTYGDRSEDGGYNASYLALPDCYSQGDAIEEALENIKEGILAKMLLSHLFQFRLNID